MSEVIIMFAYFRQNPEIMDVFERLPDDVKKKIIESGISINSVDELNEIAKKMTDSIIK